jgi:peptidoglycan/LPS O-acetylase OafA/YrhL
MLAAYIKRFWMAASLRLDWLAIGMVVAGYSFTVAGFLYRLRYEHEVKSLELTWNFTTLNVAIMTAGLFLLFRNIHANRSNSLVWRLIDDLSRMSYGMYLAHIIVLNAVHSRMAPLLGNAFFAHTNDRVDHLRYHLSCGQADIAVAGEQIPHRLKPPNTGCAAVL